METSEPLESRKIGLWAAILMVAGNMMGSGVFMLPANLASFGSICLIGWLISTAGAIMLAMVFAKLASLDPAAGGLYAYAHKAFGNYIGYQTNLVYCVANIVSNVGLCVAAIGYMTHFFPSLANPYIAVCAEIFVIWLLTYVNMLGPHLIGLIQAIATLVKLLPILGVALLGWLWFDPQLFTSSWNVSGKSDFAAISGTITFTLWAFLGVESACVSAAVVKNPRRNVPIATISGVLIAGICYILSSSVIMGMIPNKELISSSAPFADAVSIALGPAAGHIVALCASLGCLGSLGGWILTVTQSAKAASEDGLFGDIFCKTNDCGVPVSGLLIVAILMSMMALFTISPGANQQFAKLSSTAVILTLLPYLYSCIAIQIIGYGALDRRFYLFYVLVGFLGALFCLATLISSNPAQTRWSLIFVVTTMPLYTLAITRLRHIKGEIHPDRRAPEWIKWLTMITTIIVLLVTFWITIGTDDLADQSFTHVFHSKIFHLPTISRGD